MAQGRYPVDDRKERPFVDWRESRRQDKDACGVGFIYRPTRSHDTVEDALNCLARLEHRGALAADGISGDGAGIMTDVPRELFTDEGFDITTRDVVGMIFLPRSESKLCREILEEVAVSYGLSVKGWRNVPVDSSVLGPVAQKSYPSIQQVVLAPDIDISDEETDDRLFVARQKITESVKSALETTDAVNEFFIASLSRTSIVYKALTSSVGLRLFYKDLEDEAYLSNWAVFHRRFSTNTASKWKLAQPFRFIAHNGEINTINGNTNWLKARLFANNKHHMAVRDHLYDVTPDWAGSDSSVLDYALETVIREGDTPEAALMKLVPEAYENESYLKHHPEILHFYEYYASVQEPWDGPALVVFSDGKKVGATLDRNGLRPARFAVFEDGTVVLASEAGMPLSTKSKVVRRGRLGPGRMISVDLATGEVLDNLAIKGRVANDNPYGQWLLQQRRALMQSSFEEPTRMNSEQLVRAQVASGYGKEDLDNIISVMALTDKEPLFSMGDDTPIAMLSRRPRTFYDYFRQRFAQVTNPPIDPIRERVVMSLTTYLGIRPRSLVADSVLAQNLLLPSPVLNSCELEFIESLEPDEAQLKTRRFEILFDRDQGLKEALEILLDQISEAVEQGVTIVVLSDRQNSGSLERLTIPPLMATGAVHEHLIRNGQRLSCSIVVDTAQAWTSHHLACLISIGAQAVCPYLAFESVRHWFKSDKTQKYIEKAGKLEKSDNATSEYRSLTVEKAQTNYRLALEKGLLKIMSKMGVSKLISYTGSQILECLGLDQSVISMCFPGVFSPVGGLNFEQVKDEVEKLFDSALAEDVKVVDLGHLRNRREGEHHKNNPEVIKALHKAILLEEDGRGEEERRNHFNLYNATIESQKAVSIRDFLEICSDREPLPVDQVEPVEEILKRFVTGGMSLGALSKESHEALAIAMNRLGARSNSGEGGEDPIRFKPIKVEADGSSKDFPGLRNLKEGDSAASRIRQVASGRFGVTPEYLVTAEQLEIKVAQGAKPGEGGQLPGHKVSNYIAKLRRTRPGVPLISPPPHHDIYSIEDLAQLIHDLKSVNPIAQVCVKLVAEFGIGTVATGVVKANADIIHVSGHEGGTGAAPVSSIKHAGMPWELGLAETNQSLIERGLRNRVRLRADGGLRTGTDVIKAALLGADEFAFGTIALLSQGCIMARVCHTNNCPVGIATQKESLRERFSGDPGSVVRFFRFVAEEVRFMLANLGYASLSEIVGRADMLEQSSTMNIAKTDGIELEMLTRLISGFDDLYDKTQCVTSYAEEPLPTLNDTILNDAEIVTAIANQEKLVKSFSIQNTDRSIGAGLSGRIAIKYGDTGFRGRIVLNLAGSAGQSFGAFNISGVRLNLVGEANDYVGKGMSGGEIVLRDDLSASDYRDTGKPVVLAGNTCLYGATGGRLFVAGEVGERFAVRNSNADAVVEAAGAHCCEYMTGGNVIVLGRVGRNFGAGMTGGLAYVLDEDGSFATRFTEDSDKTIKRVRIAGESRLLSLIKDHCQVTESPRAQEILDNWERYRSMFVQVVPESELDNEYVVGNETIDRRRKEEPLSIVRDSA